MNRKIFTLIGILLINIAITKAQSLVNVNPLTGTANINIPIYTVTSGGVSVPVSISYNGTGVKTKDVEGTAGMGWQLNTGGQVSRNVRGLPDDCTKDNAGVNLLGWMSASNTGATYASGYTIQNNGSTCSNGATDVSNINTNIPYTNDTEPDVFYVSAPGLSLQMVYDRANGQFHAVNYQDILISYTTVGGTGNNASQIASFTITNNQGVRYTFAAPESVTESTQASGTVNYFATHYNQYKNGITYYDAWNLTSVTDANSNAVNLTYTAGLLRRSTDPVELFISGDTTQTYEYSILKAVIPQVVTVIGTSTVNTSTPTELYFNWNTAGQYSQTSQTLCTGIGGMGRQFQFTYSPSLYPRPPIPYEPGGYDRAFLTGFSDVGCGSPTNYSFGYIGVSAGITSLPDSTSNQMDYWGYFSSSASTRNMEPSVYGNPSTAAYPRYVISATNNPGSAYSIGLGARISRAVTAATVAYGSLNTITYAQGGTTTITYQPNDYFDVPSQTTVEGGGIRVQQVVDAPASGAANSITRNYTYTNSSGQSTGVPVTLPQFAFTIPPNISSWTIATVKSAYDLSSEDHTIMYSSVKESQTGAGSTVYNYYLPATCWSLSAVPVCNGCTTQEWAPTVDYASVYTCPGSPGLIANLTSSYPFVPNPNYDFERGLPSSIVSYNDNGLKASETDYTYTRTFSPSTITAFKSDDFGTSLAKFYGKYTIFYGTGELTASVVKTTYDTNGQNQAQTSSVSYTYGSAFHKLLTQQVATNSDNSTVTTNYTYVKDYAPNSGASNANINALYNLKQLNINALVESYKQVNRGTNVYTSANLTLFGPTYIGTSIDYLPSQTLAMIQPSGTTSFTPFSINTSAQTISYDPKYFVTAKMDLYDNTASLVTADDNNKHITTSFRDQLTKNATVVFANANYNEVAFNDFDSQFAPNTNTFTISGSGSYTPVGSHAGNAAGLATTQTVTSSLITKNLTAQNYIFSIWINNTGTTAGTLTFSGVSGTQTLTYAAGGGWTYYEIQVPYSAIPNPTFTLSFTSSVNISIDDILLYPDVSEAATATYDPVTHYKIAQTNTNGVSSYYTYDLWGRVLYAYDQDKNITMRKRYVTAADIKTFTAPVLSVPTPVYHGIPVTISSNYSYICPILAEGVTVTWSFNDGSPSVTGSLYNNISHVFPSNGSWTVTETLSSPLLGSVSGSITVLVTSLPYTKINYSNTCAINTKGQSEIFTVKFLQGSTVMYTFTTAQLVAGATVAPGPYTIQITPIGAKYSPTVLYGYSGVAYLGHNTSQCFPWTTSTPLTVTDDLTFAESISLEIGPTLCN
jgi:YD repeat-containing protein